MLFEKILFLDDVARSEFWPAKEFFYDMLRTIIKQSNKITIGASVRKLLENDATMSKLLAQIAWEDNYEFLHQEYIDIIQPYISERMLVIGYEMSPSLIQFLSNKNIAWLDFRISPIRFLPDLVIAIRSSLKFINKKLSANSLSKEEVELEATKIAASYRHNENYNKYPLQYKNTIFVIGQTPKDASIIKNNRYLTLQDFDGQIRLVTNKKEIVYIPHPSSNEIHVEKEVSFLKTINSNVSISHTPLYDLFSLNQDSTFIGISSGGLQEAIFFGKESIILFQPICEVLYRDDKYNSNAFWQIGFSDFLSNDFWRMVLDKKNYRRETSVQKLRKNELRQLHNVWWGYSSINIRNDDVFLQSNLNTEYKIKQMLKFCFHSPFTNSVNSYGFEGGKYFWINRVVNFSKDGKIFCNDIEEGQWLLGSTFEKSIIIIWKNGFWIDKATSINNWNELNCINYLGHKFIIKRCDDI